MLTRFSLLKMFLATVVSTGLFIGCSQNGGDEQTSDNNDTTNGTDETHDPHDVPLTEEEIAQLKADTARYEDAIAHIQKYQETIESETTGGEPAKAHRALDNLDVVLERLPEAAKESGVDKEKWQEVNETAQSLRDLFNEVHARIDAGEDPDYGAVAEEIDQGIEKLAAIETDQDE